MAGNKVIEESVLFSPVRELAEKIRTRALSPVELTQAYLDRSQRFSRLNAYATLTPDLALKQARHAEQEIHEGKYRGPLHGIPYAAKDLLAVKGYPTTWGAAPFKDRQFDFNAHVILRLEEAGAVLLGKAAMIELAGGFGYRFGSASVSGPAHNPWKEDCWTCGSSSGSGAIMAAALAAFTIGTETWGSIVCPSGFNGVSGLRPTYGRVGRSGAMALSYSMDKIGPICRTADDCGLVLVAIAGHDPGDLGSLPEPQAAFRYADVPKMDLLRKGRRLRIGWLKDPWGPGKSAKARKSYPEVDPAANAALDVLRNAGAVVTEIALPDGPWEAAGGVVISAEAAAAFEALLRSGEALKLTDPIAQVGGYAGQQISGPDYLRALRVRAIVQRKVADVFQHVDVLAAPSMATSATPLSMALDSPSFDFDDPLGGIGNLCGLPALSVPCGFTHENLPVGIQFVGNVLTEHLLVTLGNTLQMQTDWHERHPRLA
jgi:aspartyl-tRNA(Asn)/glutamyl-tRNA(Gln) amidotransferase subunit A